MAKQPDVRDRLIDAALTVAEWEDQVGVLTRRIRARPCELPDAPAFSEPCWKRDLAEACAACRANAALVHRRTRLRLALGPKRAALRRAAVAFRRSIFGAAYVPTSARRPRAARR